VSSTTSALIREMLVHGSAFSELVVDFKAGLMPEAHMCVVARALSTSLHGALD
jgi:hypothetical protein